MNKQTWVSQSRLYSLWLSIVVLLGLLTALSHSNHCGSVKTSIDLDAWVVEAHDCSPPHAAQILDRPEPTGKEVEGRD